jgi:magnesium transporter
MAARVPYVSTLRLIPSSDPISSSVIFITSNILGSVFQIASLPVVILAPLGAVSLLWNAFFACFILGDVFSVWMILGTLLIAGGAVLIAIFGIVPETTHSLEDLLILFSRPAFIAYFTLLGFAVLVCLAIVSRVLHQTSLSHSQLPRHISPSTHTRAAFATSFQPDHRHPF